MDYGGAMFYMGTNSADDDAATATNWRHQYWKIDYTSASLPIQTTFSNGFVALNIYVRKH